MCRICLQNAKNLYKNRQYDVMNFTDDQALQFTKQDFKNTYRKEIPPAKMGTVLSIFYGGKG